MTTASQHSPASSGPLPPADAPQADAPQALQAPSGHRVGFDREKYIAMQSEHIAHRRAEIGGKLYLEMGGKLFDDMHASRVLPGFTPDNKIVMLEELRDEIEILIAINAKDLERNKIRADLGISYEEESLRLVDVFRERGFLVQNIVLTQMEDGNQAARAFKRRLERLGLSVARHRTIEGYPADTETVVSEKGLGRNDWVRTSRDVIVVTAPGPGSGKLATCLSQIYHDNRNGIPAGYAKFETFPIWNLPLDHPVNLAYEAATADLDDVNMIDPFHLAAYDELAVNYNRDVEVFPLLKVLLEQMLGSSPYQSPTDMGVNMVGSCISDDEVCREAGRQEVIRRFFKALVAERRAEEDSDESDKIAIIMRKVGVSRTDRPVVQPALDVARRTKGPASAIQLADGTIITGKTTELLGSSAAMLLNALKHLAGIEKKALLLHPDAIRPIQSLKVDHLGSRNPRLHTDEVLIALSSSASTDERARRALEQLRSLRGCDVHTTTILGTVDEGIFRSLGIEVTSEPEYQVRRMFQKR
ncbi:DUF1846 domain-containing protein [Helcobacillus massiliensis]|uniref:UPF0371 protein FHX50_001986 n=1 Tax=Helcobacillus massiliensis TaxID=521392 RepID=A0A839QXZ9_9MICO|nr:DUF1846 domain-containing protein [Helcobacillus massiliensis]MBB3023689.1 uncharacterized protein (UPF0371 family) [Helcobacillus massiliensis]